MIPQASAWYAVSVTVPAEAAEAVEFAFNSLDSAGTEINEMRQRARRAQNGYRIF